MQTVTPAFSAVPTICFKPAVQFSSPCSSGSPARLPEKQITLGRPASAQALMRSIMEGTCFP